MSSSGSGDTCSTLLVHCLTVLMSSWMTRSTHLRQGVFSLTTCFFTMTSNAMSGVNSPVLRIHGETETQWQADGTVTTCVEKKYKKNQNIILIGTQKDKWLKGLTSQKNKLQKWDTINERCVITELGKWTYMRCDRTDSSVPHIKTLG